MDLREKPGKIQTFFELMLRFRLIALVVLVVATVSFVATRWQEIVSLPLAASESFGMWLAETESLQALWASSQYLAVAAVACVVLAFVFGGIRGGVASVVFPALFVAALLIMGGSESMPLPMFGILAAVGLVMFIFVKLSVACALFPFVISWILLGGLILCVPAKSSDMSTQGLWWAVFSAVGLAYSMVLALAAGKHLAAGVPQAGALVKAEKQMLVPVLVGGLLLVSAMAFDVPGGVYWPGAIVGYVGLLVWFFVFLFPIMSFGPWERLRAGSRRVEMKDKKKKSSKKK